MPSSYAQSLEVHLLTMALTGAEPVALWSLCRGLTVAELQAYRRALSAVMDVTGVVLRELEAPYAS